MLLIYGSLYLLQSEYNQYVYNAVTRKKVKLDLDYKIHDFCHGDVLGAYEFVESHKTL